MTQTQKNIDLINAYGMRVIGGIDKCQLRELDKESYKWRGGGLKGIQVKDPNTGEAVFLDCVSCYFKPTKSYYHLGKKDSCEKVARALGLSRVSHDCSECFNECLDLGIPILKSKRS